MKSAYLRPFRRPAVWFWLFVSAHVVGWAFVPAFVRDNLPLDAIEGTLWGQQWQLGYDKNPFLNGWLTAIAGGVSHPSGWMIYVFSQLSVACCFYAVWKIGNAMFKPAYALVGVVLLEAIQYYNFHAIDFNDNTLELGTWGLAMLAFYRALHQNQRRHWIALGVFATLGLMAKYYTLVLLASMALLLLVHAPYRKLLATPGPYLALSVTAILCLPHLIWLCHHDFITVRYVFHRASAAPHWTNHFYFPSQYLWQQLEVFLPAALIYGLLFLGKRPRTAPTHLAYHDRLFLTVVGLGPLLLTVLLSVICGNKLRAGWGMPLQSLWPLVLLSLIAPRLSAQKLIALMAGIFLLMGTTLVLYRDSLVHSPDASSANFPGQALATELTAKWRMTYHTPLTYVAGSRWIGGNIEYYSSDHPAVFVEWNEARAPWINPQALKAHGAIFVWDITDGETLPPAIKQQYPGLKPEQTLTLPLQRNEYNLPPQKVGYALLPPSPTGL